MTELIICRGISASGKSTYAKAWASAAPNRVRVNRDDIRFQMYGVYFGGNINENLVTLVEDAMITNALKSGASVIVDDTNIRHAFVKRIAAIGRERGAEVSVKPFHITLDVALMRNSERERQVPREVMEKQHQAFKSSGAVDINGEPVDVGTYYPNVQKPKAILVDIDGTIAHNDGHRSFYDWQAVGKDQPIAEVIAIVHWASDAGYEIVVMSGRDGECEGVSREWLDEHLGVNYEFYMREQGDQRKDSIVKRELFDTHVRHRFNVQFVLDDRNQVVDMWRSMGLRCLQVAPGDF